MDETLYRQRQAVARLFDGAATISGSIGSARGPGHIRIMLDGQVVGSGESFATALQAASTALTLAHRGTARKPRIVTAC